MMKDYLKPVLGASIVDASCGSGLFSRLFAKSGLFSLVVALDFSENMLRECYGFINQEENFPKEYKANLNSDVYQYTHVLTINCMTNLLQMLSSYNLRHYCSCILYF